MTRTPRTSIAFICGCAFALMFLTRCGGASPMENLLDGGMALLADAGLISDGGSTTRNDGGSMMEMMSADAITQSGSRLKAQYFKGTDGAQVFTQLYDSQLQVNCSFTTASDGQTRCLPIEANADQFFGDSGCTQSIAIKTSCGALKYAYKQDTSACPVGFTLYAAGAQTTQVYAGKPSSCSAVTLSNYPATWSFWRLGAVVDPSAFVQGALTTD